MVFIQARSMGKIKRMDQVKALYPNQSDLGIALGITDLIPTAKTRAIHTYTNTSPIKL
jgi:hypothetical protein